MRLPSWIRPGSATKSSTPPSSSNSVSNSAGQDERPQRPSPFSYIFSRRFGIVLLVSQTLSLCLTGTNTFSTLLASHNISLPSIQSLPAYAILAGSCTTIYIYRHGFRSWADMVRAEGWKYALFALFDVQATYLSVRAYRHTTILSVQLLNFSAILTVVLLSTVFLRVRYRKSQLSGIVLCCAGMGVLIASDAITHSNTSTAPDPNPVKGDVFALIGAILYGVTNTFEEFALSRRPVYELLGQLGLFGSVLSIIQAAIFDRHALAAQPWKNVSPGVLAAYAVGYTACLTLFYALGPVLFRMASATVFNVGNLTASFFAVLVGTRVFGLSIHPLYPPAFVMMVVGLAVYFIAPSDGRWGEAIKPWLAEGEGIDGVGTVPRPQPSEPAGEEETSPIVGSESV